MHGLRSRLRWLPVSALCTIGFVIAGCDEENGVIPGRTLVYEFSGRLQCETDGLTPQQSATKLAAADIEAVSSSCGVVTGVAFPAVCGAGTGDILLHEIRTSDLRGADQLGFRTVDSLRKGNDRNYERVNCETRAVLP